MTRQYFTRQYLGREYREGTAFTYPNSRDMPGTYSLDQGTYELGAGWVVSEFRLPDCALCRLGCCVQLIRDYNGTAHILHGMLGEC